MADGPTADARAAARADALLRLLADGRFRSGEELARVLGVSRAAVWKRVRGLAQALELQVDAVRGRGYRLASSLELLDRGRIAAALAEGTASRLAALELRGTVRSTNTELLGRRLDGGERGVVCLAEHQTAGRGRRGRAWTSPFGANLYLSLLWRYDVPPAGLSGLSLAAGVAVAEALASAGVGGVALKWPNDVLWEGRKLAGILVELGGESEGPTHAVVGVGVNWRMPETAARRIDQPWIDVAGAVAGAPPSRNLLAARLIDHLVAAAGLFQDAGLAPFLPRWLALDGLAGRPVRVALGERSVDGVELGVAATGALRVATVDGEREFHAGEVSLRPHDGV